MNKIYTFRELIWIFFAPRALARQPFPRLSPSMGAHHTIHFCRSISRTQNPKLFCTCAISLSLSLSLSLSELSLSDDSCYSWVGE